MWAMQDYIQQYQQLVCQFRSENASLRRQLNDEHSGPLVEREPLPAPRMPASPPTTNGVPSFRIHRRRAPKRNKLHRPTSRCRMFLRLGREHRLIRTTNIRRSPRMRACHADPNRYAQLASYETPIDGAAAPAVGEPAAYDASSNASPSDSATRDAATTAASPDILLSGEVIANDSGGGPRLVIDIESFDQSGRIARFDGNVSLALLTSEIGVQRRLARWDFGPDDVRSAVDTTASEPTMRFHVELPAGTKVDGSDGTLGKARADQRRQAV